MNVLIKRAVDYIQFSGYWFKVGCTQSIWWYWNYGKCFKLQERGLVLVCPVRGKWPCLPHSKSRIGRTALTKARCLWPHLWCTNFRFKFKADILNVHHSEWRVVHVHATETPYIGVIFQAMCRSQIEILCFDPSRQSFNQLWVAVRVVSAGLPKSAAFSRFYS